MKIRFFGLALMACCLVLVGCQSDANLEEALAKIALLEEERGEFESEKDLIKAEYNDVIESLNDIDLTLMEIDTREKEMENLIGDLSGKELQRETILSKIESLKDENKQAQARANKLQAKLNKLSAAADAKNDKEKAALQKIIEQYSERLKAKDEEIKNYEIMISQIEAKLKFTEGELAKQFGIVEQQNSELAEKNKSLSATNQELENTIRDLEASEKTVAECARAYVAIEDKKALKSAGIIKKIGLKLQDDYQDILSKSAPINLYQKTEIETDGVIQAILPERAASSYSIDGSVVNIKDVNVFWQTRAAVIVLK